MTDPLDVLLEPGGSTEPDPEFRRALMSRVQAALDEHVDPAATPPVDLADTHAEDDVLVFDVLPATEERQHRGSHRRLVTFAAALMALGGLGVLALLVDRDAGDETPSAPLASPPPATALRPPPSASVPDLPCPNPEGGYSNHCLGELDPGTHRTTTFEPSFTYTVPSGWWNVQDTSGNYVLRPPSESAPDYDMEAGDYIGVYASVAAPAGCDEYPDPSVATTVEAYVGWLRTQPALLVGEPEQVVIGGLEGTRVDVIFAGGPACSSPDVAGDFVPVLIGQGGSLLGYAPGERADRVDAGTRLRLILFDRPDGTLMVIEVADRSSSGDDGWWTTADEITNTFAFEPDPTTTARDMSGG